jgi:quercetin dioxygenase-like cupin family protein
MSVPPTSTVISDLIGEIAIPENATLSRVVFDNDELRVVVFALDAGQDRPTHAATAPAVVQVVKGRLTITLDGVEHEIDPGSWVHMEAHVTHAIVALEPSVMLLTLHRPT